MLNPIERIQRHVGLLAGHVVDWHERENAGYVRAGQAAIAEIDATVRALTDARAQLLDEIRRDDLDRAARVEAMLAWWDTRRESSFLNQVEKTPTAEQYVREDPEDPTRPVPPGVIGYGITGRDVDPDQGGAR